jgi:uncharacterized protein (TIGR02246 family)
MKDHQLQAWPTTSEEKGHPRRACSLFIVQWIAFLAFVGLSGPALAAQDARVKPRSQCPEAPMKCFLVLAMVLVATATPQISPDETAVRNIVQEEIAAWNSGDAAAYSRHFAADGTFTNIRGEFFTGRQPFIEKHDNLFKRPFHGSTLKQDVVSLKFVCPDVAVVEVLTSVTGIQKLFPGTNTDDKGRLRTRLLQVLVKDGREWKITAYHNTDVKSGVPVPDPQ